MAFLLLTGAAIPSASYANPKGGVVVGGSATITETGAKLDVHQNTDRVVINWQSFDIDLDEHTQFYQRSDRAIALNRVQNNNPSQILGRLSANGNMILVNPNGVFFGANSITDVNGIIATTADIRTEEFMAGRNHFNRPGKFDASIVNKGRITAKEAGLVGLVAPNVENHGVISARIGRVHLASGDTVVTDFYGDGLLKVAVEDENLTSQIVHNTGTIDAEGGVVAMTAAAAKKTINALIVAEGVLGAQTIEKKGGKIIISAAGSNKTNKQGGSAVIVQARLDASGRDQREQGGSIEILGDHIALLNGTVLDVSGHSAPLPQEKPSLSSATMTDTKQVRSEDDFLAHEARAGGTIKVGGDYLGKGETQTAKTLSVGDYVLALNDAIKSGDGGRTIFWSDESTDFNGLVFSRGGLLGGNGGFLETSGKNYLNAKGFADLTASDGYIKGTYLLDPADISIYGNVDADFVSTDSSIDLSSDLEVWLDATDIDGDGDTADNPANGTDVVTWADKSGNGNDALTRNAGERPEIATNAQNGETALYFDGSDGDVLDFAAEVPLDHVFLVFNADANQPNQFATPISDRSVAESGFGTVTNGSANFHGDSPSGNLTGQPIWAANTVWQGDETEAANAFVNSAAVASYRNILFDTNYQIASLEPSSSIGIEAVGGERCCDVNDYTWSGHIAEVITYTKTLSNNERQLVDQMLSAKWGIGLTAPGTGGTEIAKATASDGYSVFTAGYLEKLSSAADVSLLASNSITLDLKGDTLTLDNDRSLSLTTTNGSITDVSAGTIVTNRVGTGGNITLTAGGAGDITLDTTSLTAMNNGSIAFTAGGSITTGGAIAGGDVTMTSATGQDVTIGNTVTGTSSGNALIINSGANFINNAGASGLQATDASGRWLVYSASPLLNTNAGLSYDFARYNKTYAGYAPGSVSETGDGFLYSITPTLTIQADNATRQYGEANPDFAFTTSGLLGDDTVATAINSLPVLTTAATSSSLAGDYSITASTVLSDMGYNVTFLPGTLTITGAPPAEITESLPSSWEHIAYTDAEIHTTSNFVQGPVPLTRQLSSGGALNITLLGDGGKTTASAAEDKQSGTEEQDISHIQKQQQSEKTYKSGDLNISIAYDLAKSIGLTQEKIKKILSE